MYSISEKLRMLLSRTAAAVVLFIIFTAQSYWETQNSPVSLILFLMGIFLVAVASMGRMWCSLYIAGYKDNKLVTEGPYTLCRNPLYFFSMIGAVGIGCVTETFFFPVVILLAFALFYPFIVKSEERRLKKLFGVAYEAYTQRIPPFFPRFSTFSEPAEYTVVPSVYRTHMFSALWFVWLVGIIEFSEGLQGLGIIPTLWTLY